MTRELANFTSQELVRRKFTEAHGGTLSASKGRSIALHVEQGLNFLEASRDVPVSIRPLTQFYGVAALSRAVTLFHSKNLTEQGLTGGHGLSIVDWTVVNGRTTTRGFDSLEIKVSKGLFNDMTVATQSRAAFRVNSSRINWKLSLGDVPLGSKFVFGDLCGLLPGVWEEHSQWTGTSHERVVIAAAFFDEPADSVRWTLRTTLGYEAVKELFAEPVSVEPTNQDSEIIVVSSTSPHFQPLQSHLGTLDIGDVLLVPPVSADVCLTPHAILYGVSFVLSMLARYRLSDWLAVWKGERGDSVRPLFEQLMVLIQNEFPRVCADSLQNPT